MNGLFEFLSFEDERIPTELPWRDGLRIYANQLGFFIFVSIISFVFLTVFFMLSLRLGLFPSLLILIFATILSFLVINAKWSDIKEKRQEERFRKTQQQVSQASKTKIIEEQAQKQELDDLKKQLDEIEIALLANCGPSEDAEQIRIELNRHLEALEQMRETREQIDVTWKAVEQNWASMQQIRNRLAENQSEMESIELEIAAKKQELVLQTAWQHFFQIWEANNFKQSQQP